MSAENIAICSMCQMTFHSHEKILGHTCIEIKEEKIEVEDMISDQKDMNNECDLSENDSDFSPKIKKSKKNSSKKSKIKEGKSKGKLKEDVKERKRNPKNDGSEDRLIVETNKLQVNEKNNQIDGSNFELSEQFIVLILKQVDDLCENIKNGDPDLERTIEVNENLNNAVSCYRNKIFLIDSKVDRNKIGTEKENEEHFLEGFLPHSENEPLFENKIAEFDHNSPTVTKYKKKENNIKRNSKERTNGDISKKPKSSNISGKRAPIWNYFKVLESDISKASCNHCEGNFSLSTDKPHFQSTTGLKKHLKCKHQNEFSKYLKEESNGELVRQEPGKQLFSYLKLDLIKDRFQCMICNKTTAGSANGRKNLFRHIKLMHKDKLESNNTDQLAPIKRAEDCENSMCKKIYGSYERFWCENCLIISKVKQPRKKYKNKVLKDKLCPECGKSVAHLLNHMNSVHSNQELPCPHCDRICKSKMILNKHIKKVHEKVPCIHCGKLISLLNMTKHIQVQHTPDNEKKYQCDECGKGFFETGSLKDHKNIHTGEKPYKCKFCSSCFASRGTWAMHEKGHLGHKRKSYKK